MHLKASAIEFLEVLLEETDEQSRELAKGLSQDFNTDVIVKFMQWLWEVQEQHELREEARKALYRAFHVLCAMADYLGTTWIKMISGKLHSICAGRVELVLHLFCCNYFEHNKIILVF